jgi:carbon-monoxide dehydrogenase small subunit
VLAASLDGADIRTLEGMADDPIMQVIKRAFHQEHGLQCGFCTPGMLISSWDILKRNPKRDAREIRVEMSGNLCRCTGYQGIVRSIVRAGQELSSGVSAIGAI